MFYLGFPLKITYKILLLLLTCLQTLKKNPPASLPVIYAMTRPEILTVQPPGLLQGIW